MEVKSVEAIVDLVKVLPKEEASIVIEQYGNARHELGITNECKRWVALQSKQRVLRTRRFKSFMLDVEDGAIDPLEFIRFFAVIEDELKYASFGQSQEVKDFAGEINDFMWNRLGNVKVDRRLIFNSLKKENSDQ